jgi:hypothetical protein
MSDYPIRDWESTARDGIVDDGVFHNGQSIQVSPLHDTSDLATSSLVQQHDSTGGPHLDDGIQKTDCSDFKGELSSDQGDETDSIDSKESLDTTCMGNSLDFPGHAGVSVVIERVNLNIANWIDSRLRVNQQTNGEAGCSHGYSTDHIYASTGGLAHNNLGKRMRPQQDEDDDASENSRRRGGRGNKRTECAKGKETTGAMFACPYFKESPVRFGNQTSCVGPGWPKIFRLKYVSPRYLTGLLC